VQDGTAQLGLTQGEISQIAKLLAKLLKDIDGGKIRTF